MEQVYYINLEQYEWPVGMAKWYSRLTADPRIEPHYGPGFQFAPQVGKSGDFLGAFLARGRRPASRTVKKKKVTRDGRTDDDEEIRVADYNGDSMTLRLDGGRLWPRTVPYCTKLHDFCARDDDIILCTYPRSGTHWMWQLIRILVTGNLEIESTSKLDLMIEMVGCDVMERETSVRVINTHLPYHLLPPDVLRKRCKVVLVCRNPKDVAVSLYHFVKSRKHYEYSGQFPAYLDLFLREKLPYGGWFEYTKEWTDVVTSGSPCPILVVHYEQMKRDFTATMSKLGDFLGTPKTQKFYEEMERKTSFDSFKQSHDAFLSESRRSQWRGAPGFMRKGQIGEWKTWLTVAENERFDQVLSEHCGSDSHFIFD